MKNSFEFQKIMKQKSYLMWILHDSAARPVRCCGDSCQPQLPAAVQAASRSADLRTPAALKFSPTDHFSFLSNFFEVFRFLQQSFPHACPMESKFKQRGSGVKICEVKKAGDGDATEVNFEE